VSDADDQSKVAYIADRPAPEDESSNPHCSLLDARVGALAPWPAVPLSGRRTVD